MPKYLTFLPILLVTLGTISPITLAEPQPGTRIDRSTAPTPKYTGVVKQVDNIAQQITVRIEDKEGNGSGVIIAREGNTYTVVTAAHVVDKKEGYSIITPTQERIVVRAEQVTIPNKDIDIALVKFTSSQNYHTVELANYQSKVFDWVFIPRFSGRDTTHRRSLSIGTLIEPGSMEFMVKDKSSLSNGNSIIYSNLSSPGMSGGAVLDRKGRLVGINTGAENERIINQNNYQAEEFNFGYAVGISTFTILEILNNQGMATDRLNVSEKILSKLAQNDIDYTTINETLRLSLGVEPNQISTAKEWLDYGNLLWRSFESNRAIIAFDRVISILKEKSTTSDKEQLKLAYVGKGLSLFSYGYGNNEEAITAFKAAIAIDPEFIYAWYYQAKALSAAERYPEALMIYQKLIELDPSNFIFYTEKGIIFNTLKRYPEAINSFSRAIEIRPEHTFVYSHRGWAYTQTEEYDKAIADYKKAGKLFQQQGNQAKYQSKMERVERLEWISRFWQMIEYGYWIVIIINSFRIVIYLRGANGYFIRGTAYSRIKQYQLALSDYNRAIELNPQFVEAYVRQGIVHLQINQPEKAKIALKKAAKIFQQDCDPAKYQEITKVIHELDEYINKNNRRS